MKPETSGLYLTTLQRTCGTAVTDQAGNDMLEINASFTPVTKSYATPGEAISAAVSESHFPWLDERIGKLHNIAIIDVKYYDSSFELKISDQVSIVIFSSDLSVKCGLKGQNNSFEDRKNYLPKELYVKFSRQKYSWQRDKIAQQLIGKKFLGIAKSGNDVILYVENSELILFNTVLDLDAQRYFLFWSPTQ